VNAVGLALNGTGISSNGALENVNGTNTYSGSITLGSAASIGSDAGTLNLTNTGNIMSSGFLLTLTGSGNGTLASVLYPRDSGGVFYLTSGFIKSGSGTWTLTGNNGNYDTTTTINSGTLQIGDGSPNSASLGYGGVVNNGSLVYNIGSGSAITNISGTGSLIKEGTGTLTLAGTNTFSGGTTIVAGKVLVGGTSTANLVANTIFLGRRR